MELEQGSKEWFLFIAEQLRELLLGIEWSHYPRRSPPTQVAFLTPRFKDKSPPKIVEISRLLGYRHGVFRSVLRRREVAGQVFDFYAPGQLTKDMVEEVAAELGMVGDSTNLKNYVRFYHPRLLQLEEK